MRGGLVVVVSVIIGAGGVLTGAPVTAAPSCTVPDLPGAVVAATVADMGAMMGSGMMGGGSMMGSPMMGMMRLSVDPGSVRAGTVSLLVRNLGMRDHEVVVLRLAAGQSVGWRKVNSDNRIDEAGSLGEVSGACGSGEGEGLAPGGIGWTTLRLAPGRYELVCNLAGHYAAGMYAELDVSA
ncbi:MAG TPA: hypothetical protein VIJ23_15130 [Mycobacterium sp.]